jgi:hypothetical protein
VPLSPIRRSVLKALVSAGCALVVLFTPVATHSAPPEPGDLESKLRRHLRSLKHDRQVITFFAEHKWLLTDRRVAKEANRQLSHHRAHLARTMRQLGATRAAARKERQARQVALAKRRAARRLAQARARSPQAVICRVFGRYCGQALAVARCESGLSTGARNGQYRGLFQMGSSERRLFGHGAGATAQARAAHRYFVSSGRDWSPWSCKPW